MDAAGEPTGEHAAGESTGVGLAAVHERIGAVGGRVSVESAPGEGAVVGMTVPVAGRTSGTGFQASRPKW